MRGAATLALVVALCAGPSAASARQATGARLVGVSLSADTVDFGGALELRIDLLVPAGMSAGVPETLPAGAAVEGLRPVEWSSRPAEGGASAVALRYALVAYREGAVETPELAIPVRPANGPPGSPARPVDVLPGGGERPGRGDAPTRLVVPAQLLQVVSLLRLEDVASGLQPRPADDVFGRSWNVPAALSAFGFASLLLGIAFVSGRDWLASRPARSGEAAVAVDALAEARLAALAALDALLAGGPGGHEGAEAFYDATSAAVRRYVEHFDASWGAAYTSTELMRGLERRVPADAIAGLVTEMRVAEVVKFGRLRPDPDAALAHCRTLRSWVEAS